MSISGTSDIIDQVFTLDLADNKRVQVLEFRDGKALILAATAIGLYTSLASFNDPLTDGSLGYAELDDSQQLQWIDDSIVEEYKSGYVGLKDQRVILITPNAIQLFPGKKQALHNQDCISRIPLPAA
jgi:hypothetical protein